MNDGCIWMVTYFLGGTVGDWLPAERQEKENMGQAGGHYDNRWCAACDGGLNDER